MHTKITIDQFTVLGIKSIRDFNIVLIGFNYNGTKKIGTIWFDNESTNYKHSFKTGEIYNCKITGNIIEETPQKTIIKFSPPTELMESTKTENIDDYFILFERIRYNDINKNIPHGKIYRVFAQIDSITFVYPNAIKKYATVECSDFENNKFTTFFNLNYFKNLNIGKGSMISFLANINIRDNFKFSAIFEGIAIDPIAPLQLKSYRKLVQNHEGRLEESKQMNICEFIRCD